MPKKPLSIPRDGYLHEIAREKSNSMRGEFTIAPRDGREPTILLFSDAWNAMREYETADWNEPTIFDLPQDHPFHPGCLVASTMEFLLQPENLWIDCAFEFTVPKTIAQLKAIHAARKPHAIAFDGPLYKIAAENRLDEVELKSYYEFEAQGLGLTFEGREAWEGIDACDWHEAQISDNVASDLPGKSTVTAYGFAGLEPYRHPVRLMFGCGVTIKELRAIYALQRSAKKPKAAKKTLAEGRTDTL